MDHNIKTPRPRAPKNNVAVSRHEKIGAFLYYGPIFRFATLFFGARGVFILWYTPVQDFLEKN